MERLTANDFVDRRLDRPGRVVVGFIAAWCPHCRSFLPKFAARSRSGGPSLLLGDVTDEESPLWERFGIEVVPTVLGFDAGDEVWRIDGILGRGVPEETLDRQLAGWSDPRARL